MRIGILTNEYPPNVYGGAGVHVEYLARELAGLEDPDAFVARLVEFAPDVLVTQHFHDASGFGADTGAAAWGTPPSRST